DGTRNAAAADGGAAIPNSRDGRAAVGAVTVIQSIGGDAETGSADDHRIARRAMRALQIADGARDIARVNVAKSGAAADLVRAQELIGRGVRVRGHLVVLVEGGYVPRDIGIDAGQKFRDLRQLLV